VHEPLAFEAGHQAVDDEDAVSVVRTPFMRRPLRRRSVAVALWVWLWLSSWSWSPHA
jgi:hypothetical protein